MAIWFIQPPHLFCNVLKGPNRELKRHFEKFTVGG